MKSNKNIKAALCALLALGSSLLQAEDSSSRILIFEQNQIQVLDGSDFKVFNLNDNFSSNINLNGGSYSMDTLYLPRTVTVDFGMTNSGMTAEEMLASGITADMITGAGVSQTFSFNNVAFLSEEGASYILFKNYNLNEDAIVSNVQLSAYPSQGEYVFSNTDLVGNILLIEGFTDSDRYGIDYWLEEVPLGDGTWEYKVVLVPEPSTVAAILGFVALAFAAYRKRK